MYTHTQVGWVMIAVAMVLDLAVPVVLFIRLGPIVIVNVVIMACISAFILIFFSTLTVTVDRERVKISFGVGLIRKTIPKQEILSCKSIRTQWWCGWGIHGCPGKGWLYNVSGFDAVEVTMKNGMRYFIGTDEPDKLFDAVTKEG